jgi:hypothetical protein
MLGVAGVGFLAGCVHVRGGRDEDLCDGIFRRIFVDFKINAVAEQIRKLTASDGSRD